MTDFLDKKRNEIARRLNELKPAVDEHKRLEAAVAALGDIVEGSSSTASTRTGMI